MNLDEVRHTRDLKRRLTEAQATIDALLSGQIDAVVDPKSQSPVLLLGAQKALHESEERYRQIVEATTDGIMKVDEVASIVFVNQRFAEMLGYEPREMVGKNVLAFIGVEAKALTLGALQDRRRGLKDGVDSTFRHKDGADIAVNIAGTPLLDGGEHVGNLAVVRDITERKKLQTQLMVSDRMASVGTLAAGVAHEINNPLAVVIGNLECVAESIGSLHWDDSGSLSQGRSPAWFAEEIKAPLDDARDAALRVRLIVRDLKIFSRLPTEESTGPVNVQGVMESSLRMAWNEIRHRARLVKLYSAVPHVEANEARLSQVFLNLLVNAAQSLPEGQAELNEIRVGTRVDGQQVIVEVSDTGAGIPPEIIGRIFDAFFTTKAVGVGTGLGLAICQRIVVDMGGELTVESEVGKGTIFRVALPVARKIDCKTVPVALAQVPLAGRRGRILVVDDEVSVADTVVRILSKEHDVVAVAAAKEALARCAGGEQFDLILCDLMMPDMTGIDLHRELSSVAVEQADKMIFLTGGAFTENARRFLSEMAKEYIEKPFVPANLRAVVRRHMR
jgi:PAS domain S-box-containing protein